MSHFSVLICLPGSTPLEKLDDEIARRMERWDENRDVESYRDYEEGGAEDYWWVSSVRRGAKEVTPIATPWPDFVSLAQLGDITWDEARRRYREQPRIAAAMKLDELAWGDCPVVRFMSGREEYVAEARKGAVPGFALVTLDEEWIAPGRMGWFGMSSDGPGERSGYNSAVNAYLADKLAADDFVIALDCHI